MAHTNFCAPDLLGCIAIKLHRLHGFVKNAHKRLSLCIADAQLMVSQLLVHIMSSCVITHTHTHTLVHTV